MSQSFDDVVLEDLMYLKASWTPSVEESALRRDSVVLRRLLLDDNLGQYWRNQGRPGYPKIEARCFLPNLGGIPVEAFDLATVGEVEAEGISVRDVLALNRPVPNRPRSITETKTLPLDAYMRQPSLITKGGRIRRTHVVKFVAHKLGGAHFDPARDRKGDDILALLDPLIGEWSIVSREIVYAQMLSIGREVIDSPDIQDLLG